MPLGANRTDLNDTGTTYKNGFPVTLPLNVGNPITEPHDFGNDIPSSGTNENTVDWSPSPAHFGNDIGGSTPVQPTPAFDPVGGAYSGTQSVTITSADADAIYYTTDGSIPTTSSTLYSGPVSVAVSETLKALAVRAGYQDSAIGTAAYTITVSSPTFIASIEAINGGTNSTTGASGGNSSIDTTGATLLAAVVRANGTAPTISDGVNTWQYGTVYTNGSSCQMCVAWVSSPVTSTTHSFDATASEGSAEVFAFSGGSSWTLDVEAGGGTEGDSTTPDITPSAAGEILVAGLGSNGSINTGIVNNGFTGGQGVAPGTALPQALSGSPEVGMGAYLIDSAGSLISASFTPVPGNSDWNQVIAAFKPA